VSPRILVKDELWVDLLGLVSSGLIALMIDWSVQTSGDHKAGQGTRGGEGEGTECGIPRGVVPRIRIHDAVGLQQKHKEVVAVMITLRSTG
jgi:hypothetical protein